MVSRNRLPGSESGQYRHLPKFLFLLPTADSYVSYHAALKFGNDLKEIADVDVKIYQDSFHDVLEEVEAVRGDAVRRILAIGETSNTRQALAQQMSSVRGGGEEGGPTGKLKEMWVRSGLGCQAR